MMSSAQPSSLGVFPRYSCARRRALPAGVRKRCILLIGLPFRARPHTDYRRPQYCAAQRRHKQKRPQDIRKETGGQQEHGGHNEAGALDNLSYRRLFSGNLFARTHQHADALEAQNCAARDGRGED